MSALDQIPGLGGYLDQQQRAQAQSMGQLQQAGTVLGIQDTLQKQAKQQEYQSAVAALGPNPSTEALAQVVSKFNPEKGLDIRQRSEDRKDAAEQRATQFAETLRMKEEGLAQQKAAFEQRTTDTKARDEFNQWMKQQQLVLQQHTASFNQEMKKLGLEITRQGNELRLQKFDVQQRDQEDRQIQQQIAKTVTAMKDVQPVLTAGHQLNDIMSRYTPQDVPGLGYGKNTDLGKALLTQEGKDVASSVKLFGNAVLKAMSGTAVTAPEEIRQMAAQMADGRFSAEDFYTAWPKMAKWVSDQGALATANLGQKAKEQFIERTKLNLDPIKPRFTFDGKQLQDSRAPAAKSPVDALLEKYK